VIKLAVVYPELGTDTFVYVLPVYDSTESALTGAAKHIASTPQVTNIVFFIGPPSSAPNSVLVKRATSLCSHDWHFEAHLQPA
jgi:hypothetical protein